MTEAVLHYNRVARAFHWVVALLVVVNIAIGIFHDPLGEIYQGVMGIHKSIGFVVLALAIFRLYWRVTHPAPPLPDNVSNLQGFIAHGVHWLFYGLMIIMPMTGWILSSGGKYPLEFFGLFDIPKLAVEPKSALQIASHNAHVVFGFGWAALLAIHVGAALHHQFVLKDNVLNRIWPGAPGQV